jgi:magnesium transporter
MQIKKIEENGYTWINIFNPSQEDIPHLVEEYKLGKFLLQDSLEPGHLPKLEHRLNYVFFILRAYTADKEVNATSVTELSNKISFFVFEDKLITIHKAPFHFLNESKLMFSSIYEHQIALFNFIVNTFDQPAEWHSQDLDEVEEIIFLRSHAKISLEELYFQKAEIRLSKKLLMLIQQVFNKMEFPPAHLSAFSDMKDSVIQYLLEFDEAIHDANNITNTYLSINAQKSNDVMKVLTVFSAFFLPLSFIVGLYGMNFKFMPELEFTFGYPAVLLLMVTVCVLIYLWFKRKRYL